MLITVSVVMMLQIWHLGFSHFLLPVDATAGGKFDLMRMFLRFEGCLYAQIGVTSNTCTWLVRWVTEAKNLVETLSDSNRQVIQCLLPDQPLAGIFHGLHKLHKLIQLINSRLNDNSLITLVNLSSISDIIAEATKLNIRPPYRPIVSCIGTITEHISGFEDSILQPLLQKIPSCLKDTPHFLRNLSYIGTLAPGSMLISMDVNSLCTNNPHADGVTACRTFLNKHNIQSDIATDIPILIDFILKHNTFTFNDKYYLQGNSTAMGTKMAPAYANIFMESVENSFLSSFPLMPTVYNRDIDDIFMIWTHGIDIFKQFLNNATTNITLILLSHMKLLLHCIS